MKSRYSSHSLLSSTSPALRVGLILWCWSLPLEGEAGCPVRASGLSDSVFRVVSGWTIPMLGAFLDIASSAVLSVGSVPSLAVSVLVSLAVSDLVSCLLPVDSVLSVAVSVPASSLLLLVVTGPPRA